MTEVGRANATASAAMFAEWARRGVDHVVVAPGSRSTPLALAAAERAAAGELELHVQLDERSAAFIALGIGLETGTPAVLVCTSGTAAANFTPAVVEAGLSAVPMIVATADRPPELRDRGAPQTIDQVELYGRAVRWFVDIAPPDEADPHTWREIAAEGFERSRNGPVHLNVTFREPLIGSAEALPSPADSSIDGVLEGETTADGSAVTELSADVPDGRRGVIIAGGRSLVDPTEVARLAVRLGWPLIADPQSGLRGHPNAITASDSLLRSPSFADAHVPDLVVRIGRPPTSKVVNRWVIDAGCPLVQIGGPGRVDPDHNVTAVCEISGLDSLSGSTNTPWLARWRHQNAIAEDTIDAVLRAQPSLTEPAVARQIANSLGARERLVVSSSMPVRDLEWYGGSRARAIANRGANGIDGVLSTAFGVAMTGLPTKVLIGDLALIHDSNAFVGARHRSLDLTVIVVDNDGGGIFSFLPQATELDPERFELLFGTPTGTDVEALAAAHGVATTTVTTPDELSGALEETSPWVRVVRVPSDRGRNVEVHSRLNDAVVAAIERGSAARRIPA